MLLGKSKNVAARVSNPLKMRYFWRIRHIVVNIAEKSEQHLSMKLKDGWLYVAFYPFRFSSYRQVVLYSTTNKYLTALKRK